MINFLNVCISSVAPMEIDELSSPYELLAQVLEKCNELVLVSDELEVAMIELKHYVDDYFVDFNVKQAVDEYMNELLETDYFNQFFDGVYATQEELDAVTTELQGTNDSISELDTTITYNKQLAENAIQGLQEQIDNIEVGEGADLTELQEDVETLQSQMIGVQTRAGVIEQNVTVLQGDIVTLQNEIDNLEVGGTAQIKDITYYGAIDDGETSIVQPLLDAIADLPNGGTILFPPTENGFAMDDSVTVPIGINLQGDNTEIIRLHDWHVSNNALVLKGNNKMSGFIWNGGGVDTVEYINYTDISIHGTGAVIENNVFDNCRGTIMGGYGSCIVTDNSFYNYGDHLIYMGGGDTLDSGDYIFTGNRIVNETSTRDCIKFRNNGQNTIFSDNIFDIPQGIVFNFTMGDNYLKQGTIQNILFTSNNIIRSRILGQVGQTNVSGDDIENDGHIKNIVFSDNIINSTQYMLIGDSMFTSDVVQGYLNDCTVSFLNNEFKTVPQFHISCVDTVQVEMRGNTFYIEPNTPSSGTFIGIKYNVNLDFTDNVIFNDDANATSLISTGGVFSSADSGYEPTQDVKMNICNNIIHGVRMLIYENQSKTSWLNDYAFVMIRDNTIYKTELLSQLGTSIGTGAVYLYNNMYIHAGEQKQLYVSRETTYEVGYDNMTVLTGGGTPVGSVSPRYAGDTYIDTTGNAVYVAKSKADKSSWINCTDNSGGGGGTTTETPVLTGVVSPVTGAVVPDAVGQLYLDTATYTVYVAFAIDWNTWRPVQQQMRFGSVPPKNNVFADCAGIQYYDTTTDTIWTSYARGNVSWISDRQYGEGTPVGTVAPRFIGDMYVDTSTKQVFFSTYKNDSSAWQLVQRGTIVGTGEPTSTVFAEYAGIQYVDTTTAIVWTAYARGALSWTSTRRNGTDTPVGSVAPRYVGDMYCDTTNRKIYLGTIPTDNNGWIALN